MICNMLKMNHIRCSLYLYHCFFSSLSLLFRRFCSNLPPPPFFPPICLSPAHFLPVTIRVFCNKVCQKIHCFCIKNFPQAAAKKLYQFSSMMEGGHPPSVSSENLCRVFYPSVLHIFPTFVSLVPQLSFSTVCLYSKYSLSFQIIVSPLILPWKQVINKQSFLSLLPHF